MLVQERVELGGIDGLVCEDGRPVLLKDSRNAFWVLLDRLAMGKTNASKLKTSREGGPEATTPLQMSLLSLLVFGNLSLLQTGRQCSVLLGS